MRKAVFLDRDGTIIIDKRYLATVEGVELLERAAEGLRRMAELGYLLVLISNQSGVGRGYFTAEMVELQHARLQELLQPHGVRFAMMLFCPHSPERGCSCRKPAPAMILQAARHLDIDCGASFMIGDKVSDIDAGAAAGCKTIFIGEDTEGVADAAAADLLQAAEYIARTT